VKTSDFDYELPKESIAQFPIEPRDSSRLLVMDRKSGERIHTHFNQIADFLNPGDLLVVNHSRVIPARLSAFKVPTGGKVELLLLERIEPAKWKALVGGKGLTKGKEVELENGIRAVIEEELTAAQRILRFDQPLGNSLAKLGKVPLPPYIHETLQDPERYQTVYAKEPGSAAAPTAGLHLTPALLSQLAEMNIELIELTLHIGLDTFAPVKEDDPEQHLIHREWCQLNEQAVQKINVAKREGRRVVAVGTTSVRVLESAARDAHDGDAVAPFEGFTDLFILPGYEFKVVDALITNFHLPRSTLLMLVSAFSSPDFILDTYQEAIKKGYRFYSFGDAMLMQ
jgi:S-adenosylmethionine:tRNA ribosyltransferase-isomerase